MSNSHATVTQMDLPTAFDWALCAPTLDARCTFEEHEDLKAILWAGQGRFYCRVVCEVSAGNGLQSCRFPVFTASIGSSDPGAPAVGFFGGIHGLEHIGTQVILHYMRSLLHRLEWDDLLAEQLKRIRLVFMPLINPGGMWRQKRANPNGVDLMRNAAQRADGRVPFLAGGQTISPWLPWYCGQSGAPMELESAAVLQVVREQLASRPFSLALDCHSGYGFGDSLWFPYAKTRRLMAHLPEMFAFKAMLEKSMPHHSYRFEPQSAQYLSHGDLWDHAYDASPIENVFLPLTLELGSWLWIRKNPLQIFTRRGMFNPVKAHRITRVLRRHAELLDFLTRAAFSSGRWLPSGEQRMELHRAALAHWRQPTAAP
jgi:Zinc carboxypeptidase